MGALPTAKQLQERRARWNAQFARIRGEDPLWTLPSEAITLKTIIDPLWPWFVLPNSAFLPKLGDLQSESQHRTFHPVLGDGLRKKRKREKGREEPSFLGAVKLVGEDRSPVSCTGTSQLFQALQENWAKAGGEGELTFRKGSILIHWREPASEEVIENFIDKVRDFLREGLRQAGPHSWWRGVSPPELISVEKAPTRRKPQEGIAGEETFPRMEEEPVVPTGSSKKRLLRAHSSTSSVEGGADSSGTNKCKAAKIHWTHLQYVSTADLNCYKCLNLKASLGDQIRRWTGGIHDEEWGCAYSGRDVKGRP